MDEQNLHKQWRTTKETDVKGSRPPQCKLAQLFDWRVSRVRQPCHTNGKTEGSTLQNTDQCDGNPPNFH